MQVWVAVYDGDAETADWTITRVADNKIFMPRTASEPTFQSLVFFTLTIEGEIIRLTLTNCQWWGVQLSHFVPPVFYINKGGIE